MISEAQGSVTTKKKMAKRLLNGDGVDKDEAKAVSLLEDCVALGDTDAMVMLAKCCALARGMEHDAERAEALLSDAAQKGNHEARILMQLINNWNEKESVGLKGLPVFTQNRQCENSLLCCICSECQGETHD